jgi:EAL domain-containing protein (putative c-di-GMP-specific phosphodiesterase class I)
VQQVELLEEFLAAKTIRAVLQPVVKLGGGSSFEMFGVEGLARGPQSSILGSPSFLLAYAARKELLFEADMICIRAALTEVRHLTSPVTTFLNVQPPSLTNPEFTTRLCDEVLNAGLETQSIVLELTEQQTIVNPRAFASTLHRLRDRGFRIALDDFGEGSSNLNLFQDLRPDFLKISGTFCRNLAHDKFQQIIAAVLQGLGINYAQGYFFLRPLPGRELTALLSAGFPARNGPPRLVPLDLAQPAS